MLDKYRLICLVAHKGAEVSEQYRIKRLTNCLSSAINTAIIEWNIPLKMNPVSMIRWKHTDQPRDRRFEDGEESQRLSNVTPLMARMITVAVETAVRRSKILRIRRSHINFAKQTLEISLTKTGKPRTIPLLSRALKAIKEQLRDLDKVISIEEQPTFQIIGSRLFKYFQQPREEIGIIDFRWHDVRHEATTRLFEKGLNIMEVAPITGHEDLKMLKRYGQLRAEDLVARLG